MNEQTKVFVSYRREDTRHVAGRLADRLGEHFHVFMDIDTIEPGMDFTETIQSAVSEADVFVAVIGNQWTDLADETGQRRLDDPADWVSLEIASALQRNVPVIPVLVDGARMPTRSELPAVLSGLASRQAVTLRHESFTSDASRLIAAIERRTPGGATAASSAASGTPPTSAASANPPAGAAAGVGAAAVGGPVGATGAGPAGPDAGQLAAWDAQATQAAVGGRWPESISLLEKIQAADPNYAEVGHKLAIAHRFRRIGELQGEIRSDARAGNWADVAAAGKELNSLDPAQADPDGLVTRASSELAETRRRSLAALYERSVQAESSGRWGDAAAALQELNTQDPANAEVARRLAAVRARLATPPTSAASPAGPGGMGQPGTGPTAMGQPGMGQPGMGQPGTGQAAMGRAGAGQSGMGQPGGAQAGPGQVRPGMGPPAVGQPGYGQPSPGPAAGQPGYNQAPGAQPGYQPPNAGAGQPALGQRPADSPNWAAGPAGAGAGVAAGLAGAAMPPGAGQAGPAGVGGPPGVFATPNALAAMPPPKQKRSATPFVIGGIVLVVVLAVVITLGIIGSQAGGTATPGTSTTAVQTPTDTPTPSDTPSDTPTPTAGPTGVAGLLTHIPSDIRDTCKAYTPDPGALATNLEVAVHCSPTGTGAPADAWYFQYADKAATDAAFKGYVTGTFTKGDCTKKDQTLETVTTEGGKELPGGVLKCYVGTKGSTTFAWTHEDLHILTFAQDNKLTFPKMKTWWTHAGPYRSA